MSAAQHPHRALRIHGGTDALGPARFDFSTNSNACGPCPAALAAVQAADATRYPDAGYTRLRQALAGLHGVDAWRIVLAASASEFIFRITAWTKRSGGRRVWIPAAAYGDYAHGARAWGLEHSAEQEAADLVWACEPSSPLGQAHGQWPQWLQPAHSASADAAGVLGSAQAGRQTLVLDGAYAALRLSGAASLQAAQRDQVWQLYSPNKALALTGIRAAYAIAPRHGALAAQQLDAMAPSWPVGAHGEAMLLAWVLPSVQQWVAQTLPMLRDWKQTQVAMLNALGWHCLPSDTPFFCARPPAQADLPDLLPRLRAQGIQLRDARSLGLPGHVRLSVQQPLAQQALQAALVEAVRPAAPPTHTTTASNSQAHAAPRPPSLETNP